MIFFLKYTGELHNFVLIERENGPVQSSPPHSGPAMRGLEVTQICGL